MFGLAEGQADITFPAMMLTQKLTMFAWNVQDGRMKVEVNISLHLVPYQGERRIVSAMVNERRADRV
jgi:hypothetical protein